MTRTSEEKGEPKRIRTEVPLLTSLTPYRWAKPAHTDTGLAGRSEDQEGGPESGAIQGLGLLALSDQ